MPATGSPGQQKEERRTWRLAAHPSFPEPLRIPPPTHPAMALRNLSSRVLGFRAPPPSLLWQQASARAFATGPPPAALTCLPHSSCLPALWCDGSGGKGATRQQRPNTKPTRNTTTTPRSRGRPEVRQEPRVGAGGGRRGHGRGVGPRAGACKGRGKFRPVRLHALPATHDHLPPTPHPPTRRRSWATLCMWSCRRWARRWARATRSG